MNSYFNTGTTRRTIFILRIVLKKGIPILIQEHFREQFLFSTFFGLNFKNVTNAEERGLNLKTAFLRYQWLK